MNVRVEPHPTLEATAFVAPPLRAEVARVMNLAAMRRSVPARVGGREVRLRLRPARGVPAPHAGRHARLRWMLGGEAAVAVIPCALLEALCLPLPDVLPGALAEDAAALLTECVLAHALAVVEAALVEAGVASPNAAPAIAFVSLSTAHACDDDAYGGRCDGAPFCLEVEHEKTVFAVPLALGPAALAALPDLLRRLPRRVSEPGALPVQLCVRIGLTELDVAALAALRPGDAVLLQETGLLDGRLALVVGEQKIATARLGAAGMQTETPLRPVRGTPLERWCMDPDFSDPVEDGVGALRVTLVFELGRRLASLAEIEAMGPGSVVQAGAAPDGMVDVLANGRRIGRGRIVQVGGALAVQLERINHGAAA